MAMRKHRYHSPAFKAKVALAIVKDEKTQAELTQHPHDLIICEIGFAASLVSI